MTFTFLLALFALIAAVVGGWLKSVPIVATGVGLAALAILVAGVKLSPG